MNISMRILNLPHQYRNTETTSCPLAFWSNITVGSLVDPPEHLSDLLTLLGQQSYLDRWISLGTKRALSGLLTLLGQTSLARHTNPLGIDKPFSALLTLLSQTSLARHTFL